MNCPAYRASHAIYGGGGFTVVSEEEKRKCSLGRILPSLQWNLLDKNYWKKWKKPENEVSLGLEARAKAGIKKSGSR